MYSRAKGLKDDSYSYMTLAAEVDLDILAVQKLDRKADKNTYMTENIAYPAHERKHWFLEFLA